MQVVFVSKETEVVKRISKLMDKNNSLFFDDIFEFLKNFDENITFADMLIFDFRFFHHCKSFVFSKLKNSDRRIPLIFYNDPFAERKNRVVYWIRRNENLFESFDFEYLSNFFSDLNLCLENENVKPFVSNFQPLQILLPDSELIEETSFFPNNFVDSLMEHLTPVLFKIFSHFRENADRDVSVSELLSIDEGMTSEKTVYSYISRLRKSLRPHKRFKILRTGKGKYRLFEMQK